MDYRYEIVERSPGYDGFFRLDRYRVRHELFEGGWSETLDRELLDRGLGVAVLPYDPERDRVVLVEQFRMGALDVAGGPWMLELIAGMCEPDESPEDVAVREAREEAGIEVRDAFAVSEFLASPGGSSERLRLYCARVDTDGVGGVHGLDHEGEDIRVHVLDRDAATALLTAADRPLSATTVVGLQWLELQGDALARRFD